MNNYYIRRLVVVAVLQSAPRTTSYRYLRLNIATSRHHGPDLCRALNLHSIWPVSPGVVAGGGYTLFCPSFYK